ncbi:MAG TPA: LLM class flavin-dependent oxidoreductase [Methylomirabilota bacterium]|jgi:alkanesulfonate monooxygenase SsuD/methylene tetrahydromethanopterin reductase-like flavin-dependent oxidoreductase (luciferase family)
MKVGIALNMLTKEGRSDASVVGEHMALGDLAEPLGFDSLWALEHHFTGYAMSPAPTQLLAYYAGRTRRIMLGTAVIVLPWHDPIRVAEQIALLDIMSGGRCLFGFGRGAATVEYAGFRVPMEEARPRFVEAARIVVKALTDEVFEWDGEFFTIPRTSIRPRPISHPERRFYASSVSPESAEIMARLGFGVLVVMQNEWPKAAEDIQRYREIAAAVGHTPRPPIILTNVSVAESRAEARERAVIYLSRKWDSIDNHYHFSDGHLATVKGYEFYGGMAKTYSKMKDAGFRQKATDFYVKIQIVGTPDDCLQQIAELQRLTGVDHLVTEFAFGGMPHEQAELNMRLFADRVVPVLQRDRAFGGPANGAPTTGPGVEGATGIFAPA